ncbi:MAG: HAMP domain-containing protein [Rhodospirillaceae bacterium]|nr:HAMP domain-containing protein [Rhodospirillaceae bacterium]
MADDPNFQHEFLDLKGEGMDDRTFLGGVRLGVRTTLFWLFGFVSLVILGGIFIHVDQRIVSAIDDWRVSREVSLLMTRVQSGLARAEVLEKTYVLDKKRHLADGFSDELTRVGSALDALYQFPQAGPARQHIATLRDGLVQYGQQFSQFVTAEEALGLTTESGISPRLQSMTDEVQKGFTKAGFANLTDQFARIVREGAEVLRSGSRQGVTEVRERYRTLNAFLKASRVPKAQRSRLRSLLNAHEADMMSTINSRFALESERQRFGEILAYVAPSTDALSKFGTDLDLVTARRLDRARSFARYTIAGATLGIFLWFIFAGMLLIRSIVGPLRAVSEAALRLASGDRGTRIPARGNTDAIGQIARSLDKWIDDLVEADMVGRELEQTRAKLELTAAEAERKVQAAAEQAAAAIRAELETPDPVPEQPIEPPRPEPISAPQEQRGIPAPLETLSGAGPISSISQQLTHFSEYVTAAAHDVERTEALIRSLSDSTSHIEVLGNLVTAIRDQVNLLAFRTSPRDYVATDRENLIPFNNDERQGMSDPVTAGRLDSIRESTDRAERTLQSVRASMDNVTAIAQDIASTASGQALEATNKLLSQSQYLQNMLDDIMTRIHPPATNRLAPPTPEQNPADRPWTGVPPRKA